MSVFHWHHELLNKRDMLKIIKAASKDTGIEKYIEFTEENTEIKRKEIRLINGIFKLNNWGGGPVQWEVSVNPTTFLAYFVEDPKDIQDFLESYEVFLKNLMSKNGIGYIKRNKNEKIEMLYVLGDIYKELKKKYPGTIYNISRSQFYISEFDGVPVHIRLSSIQNEVWYDVAGGYTSIMVMGNNDKIKEDIVSGDFLKRIESLLMQNILLDQIVGSAEQDFFDLILAQWYSAKKIESMRKSETNNESRRNAVNNIKRKLSTSGYDADDIVSNFCLISKSETQQELDCFKYRGLIFSVDYTQGMLIYHKDEKKIFR